jgi:glycosyltransferase involved in cell wall biosynthesis
MSLRFSVITPSFCQGSFIERTIQSVLAQGLSPTEYEYVVCDGGSNDETLEILKHYEGQLRWISEPDKGQADAVNKGIAMTTGEIIAWINSDDVYYPGAFEAVRAVFEAHPEVQVVYGDADFIDEQDQVFQTYLTEPWNYERLIENCYLCQPAVFFRRNLVEKLGNLDDSLNYCMDYELWLRYGRSYPFYYLRKKLACSRLYSNNKTMSQTLKCLHEANDMLLKKFGRVPDTWLFMYINTRIEKCIELYKGYSIYETRDVKAFISTVFWAFLRWRKSIPIKELINYILFYRMVKLSKNSVDLNMLKQIYGLLPKGWQEPAKTAYIKIFYANQRQEPLRSAYLYLRRSFLKRKLFGTQAHLVPPLELMYDGPKDYEIFKQNGEEFFTIFVNLCGLKANHRVLDIGSGIGRKTLPLLNYLTTGSYEGLDLIEAQVKWCQEKFSPEYQNFHFQRIDVWNELYNPSGKVKASEYQFPFEDGEFDFVILGSVFTHMFVEDMRNYVSEISRVLKPGARGMISYFLLNPESEKLIAEEKSTLNLVYEVESGCKADNPNRLETAVGHDEGHVIELYERFGMRMNIFYGSWCGRAEFLSYQDILVVEKV